MKAKKAVKATPKPKAPAVAPKITNTILAKARGKTKARPEPFTIAQHPPGIAPDGNTMAQDSGVSGPLVWANRGLYNGAFAEGLGFLGYPYLAELAQRPEYRRISETIATEMTRKWVKVQATGDEEDKTDKVKKIEAELKRLNVQDCFRKVAEQDGFFGRGHIYIDTGETDDREELQTPIGDGRNEISKAKVGIGALKRLRTVEAVWCYPSGYNSDDPLKPNWYKPDEWYVMGRRIHSSRFLTFIGREVPDLLKPAYSFGGLSLSQMAKPYVDNWLRTRQSVTDIVSAFSVFVLAANLGESLQADGDQLFKRADLFNQLRDNRGLMLIDKATEEFQNVSTSLAGLDELQAQAQEHICSVVGIPLVKYTGISPQGLNASSDGEIRVFYDWIHAYQVLLFSVNLNRIMGFIQLSLFGEVDPEITWIFEPLWSLDEEKLAMVRKTEAETGQILIDTGVISPAEERQRIGADPEAPYASLDVDDLPDLLDEESDGLEPVGGRPQNPALVDGGSDPHTRSGSHKQVSPQTGGAEPTDESISEISLNGAQVSSMIDVVAKIGSGELSVESGKAILLTAFPINEARVDKIIAGAGKSAPPQEAA